MMSTITLAPVLRGEGRVRGSSAIANRKSQILIQLFVLLTNLISPITISLSIALHMS
jgi:hypothetical protein